LMGKQSTWYILKIFSNRMKKRQKYMNRIILYHLDNPDKEVSQVSQVSHGVTTPLVTPIVLITNVFHRCHSVTGKKRIYIEKTFFLKIKNKIKKIKSLYRDINIHVTPVTPIKIYVISMVFVSHRCHDRDFLPVTPVTPVTPLIHRTCFFLYGTIQKK
jgi:hypothetical protein